MRHQFHNLFFRSLMALALAATVFTWSAPAQAACLSSSQTRQAVASGQARPLGSLRVNGQILSAKLCQQGGRLVYVLSVLNNGNVSQVTLDARTGRRL
ncbi:hypothetical protein [Pseudovibrio sp. Ad26]|uniref:PepSY domain-containing protein n=1 Tax=Pseudovibrio sp. Ad26 TaxID=989410 RepID=UPI001AD8D5D0|nr:hypothetical protein [Pseudovibrio sp. Ad26]